MIASPNRAVRYSRSYRLPEPAGRSSGDRVSSAIQLSFVIRHSGFVISPSGLFRHSSFINRRLLFGLLSSFGFGHSSFSASARDARGHTPFGGSFTTVSQNPLIDFTTVMNWSKSTGFVI